MRNIKQKKWDLRFIKQAELISTYSKDPSTQTGAVIVRPDKTIASMGFNGFPRNMKDDKELYNDRPTKYQRIIHCEMNAIINSKEDLNGYTLYTWPFLTCDRCAIHVIQTGISEVVAPKCPSDKESRWEEKFKASRDFYKEAGVEVLELEL